MQKGFTRSLLLCMAFAVIALQSCKKEDTLGIDNDKIIRTPYSLFLGTDHGWLLKSNDAEKYTSVFPADGYPCNALLTYKTNLLFVKNNLHLSTNDGKNFDPVFDKVKHFPWQEMIVSAEKQGRIYITSTEGKGVSYSEDSGKTWKADDAFEEGLPPFEITSFTVTEDGAIYGLSYKNFILFKKANAGANWEIVMAEGLLPSADARYFITSRGNDILVTDYSGKYHDWHSEDGGVHWSIYYRHPQLTGNIHRFTSCAATDGPWLVGTEAGIFRGEGEQLVPSSIGLETNTIVYRMVVKKNIYKNGVINEYVFAATNNGIYRSEDKGYTWDKVTSNDFDIPYVSMY